MIFYREVHLERREDDLKIALPYQHTVLINEISSKTFEMKVQASLGLVDNESVLSYLNYIKTNMMRESVYLFYKGFDSVVDILYHYLHETTLDSENRTIIFQLFSNMSSVPFIFGKYLYALLPYFESQFPTSYPMVKKEIMRIFFNLDLLSETKAYQLDILEHAADEPELLEQLCWGIYIYSKNPEPARVGEFSELLYSVIRSYEYLYCEISQISFPEKLKELSNSILLLIEHNLHNYILEYDLQSFLYRQLRHQSSVRPAFLIISHYIYNQRELNLEELAILTSDIILSFEFEAVFSAIEFLKFCQCLGIFLNCEAPCEQRISRGAASNIIRILQEYLNFVEEES